jgi:diadenosine tetraphosphatase ApaH/serine/threonine PP2A family protein phosphatase
VRVLVVSDVHSNLTALDAVLEAAGTVDAVWHLGDIVGCYGPDPDAVVARLRELGSIGVKGNHDAAAVGGDEIDWFNADARRAMEWTRATISAPTTEWLRAQPAVRVIETFTLVHGSPRDPLWEYILSADVAADNLAAQGGQHGLHGHTHVPIVWSRTDGRVGGETPEPGRSLTLTDDPVLLNPGSVGQPRDGIAGASYLILDTQAPTATWQRIDYDVEAVQARMRDAGLPRRLVERLALGL